MRRKTEQLRGDLAQFIAQRDDLHMAVRCSDSDTGLVAKVIESLDEASMSELFWVVVDDFKDAVSYAEACVKCFSTKHDAARLVLEKQGKPPLPMLPPELLARVGLPPAERVRRLIIFSRSLLPSLQGCGVVWALLPVNGAGNSAWTEFIAALWKHEMPFPWCHHVRMIARDTFPNATLKPALAGMKRVREMVADFSPAAIRAALEEETSDERAPLAERVNNTLLLAGMDFSHGRYDRAVQQYEIVHRFAAATQNPVLAALALNGLGEVKKSMGQPEQAGQIFQAAIGPAAQAAQSPSPPVPVLFNLYLNLGELRHAQKKWGEAETYLQGAGDFALLLHNAEQRLHCWKLLGEAQQQQGKVDDAVKTWSNGAIVAGRLKMNAEHQDFSKRVGEHFMRRNDQEGLRAAMKRIHEGVAAHEKENQAAKPDTAAAQKARA